MTPLPIISFTIEEITGCTTEAAKDCDKAPRNLLSCFLLSCFPVSVTPLINTPEFCTDFMTLIISFTSSFEKNKLNFFSCSHSSFSTYFSCKFID